MNSAVHTEKHRHISLSYLDRSYIPSSWHIIMICTLPGVPLPKQNAYTDPYMLQGRHTLAREKRKLQYKYLRHPRLAIKKQLSKHLLPPPVLLRLLDTSPHAELISPYRICMVPHKNCHIVAYPKHCHTRDRSPIKRLSIE